MPKKKTPVKVPSPKKKTPPKKEKTPPKKLKKKSPSYKIEVDEEALMVGKAGADKFRKSVEKVVDKVKKIIKDEGPSKKAFEIILNHIYTLYGSGSEAYRSRKRLGPKREELKTVAHLKQLLNMIGIEFKKSDTRGDLYDKLMEFLVDVKYMKRDGNIIWERELEVEEESAPEVKVSRGDNEQLRRVERNKECDENAKEWEKELKNHENQEKGRYEIVKREYSTMKGKKGSKIKRESTECLRRLALFAERKVSANATRDETEAILDKYISEKSKLYKDAVSIGKSNLIVIFDEGYISAYLADLSSLKDLKDAAEDDGNVEEYIKEHENEFIQQVSNSTDVAVLMKGKYTSVLIINILKKDE